MAAAYHQTLNINRRKVRTRSIEADVLERIQRGPRPHETIEYKFSSGVRKKRANADIYGWANP